MDCLRFAICAHETISEDPMKILPNALMTATGGQIPAHESISEDPMRILRNALMSTKNVYEQMDQNHCAHESIDEDHFESRVASRTWATNLCRTRAGRLPALAVAPCGHTVWTLLIPLLEPYNETLLGNDVLSTILTFRYPKMMYCLRF